MRVYLDSCIIIYLIEGTPDLRDRINRRLLAPADAIPTAVFTDLSRLECRVKPLASGDAMLLRDFDEFFATPGYVKFTMGTPAFDSATDLRARYGLKTPDALHLAAAIASGCEQIWTNDGRLTRAAQGRISVLPMDQIA